MGELFQQIKLVFLNLFNTPELMKVLANKEITTAAFIALALIIFTETGLLVGFFLPGDSLLVTVGIVAYGAGWSMPWLIIILSLAAIVGDTVGYWIGAKSGPKIFRKEKSFFFRPSHLQAAQDFYQKHGGKTIILARFMPFIRTFAPVVAGVGKMDYRRFLMFNIIGGIGWVASMLLLGYALPAFLDVQFKKIFGPEFQIQKHIEKVIILVVLLSISPGLYVGCKEFYKRYIRKTKPATPPVTTSTPVDPSTTLPS
ncbi:MAG: VTT domain-containing protein [Zavarzinella sp.]